MKSGQALFSNTQDKDETDANINNNDNNDYIYNSY